MRAAELKRERPEEDENVKRAREEQEILNSITVRGRHRHSALGFTLTLPLTLPALQAKQALMSAKELAKGTVYLQAMETGWKPPSHIRAWSAAQCDEVRSAHCFHITNGARSRHVPRRFGASGTSSSKATTFRPLFATFVT